VDAPSTWFDDIMGALTTGRKACITTGGYRWWFVTERPDKLVAVRGRANSIWSGHRLSVVTAE